MFQTFQLALFVACAVFASANAGVAVTSGSDNTYRSPGNLAQISTQSKTIDTPYSSSSKTDVRVSNPSVYVTAQPALSYSAHPVQTAVKYASPAPSFSYAAAPVAHSYYPQQQQQAFYHAAQPVNQVYAAAPAPAYHIAQHAPVSYSAPAVYSHAAPAYTSYAHAAPLAAAHQPLVKIAYSPANQVSHFTYSNINDHSNFAW